MKKIISNNWAYCLWFVYYFLLSFWIMTRFIEETGALFLTLLIYGISIIFSLSEYSDFLVYILNGIKPVETRKDKEYLLPLFEEVYKEALAFNNVLYWNIEIHIIESYEINAIARGRSMIAVTRGAILGLSKEQLKGVIAHELGHHSNGNTTLLMLVNIGNGFFSFITYVVDLIILALKYLLLFSSKYVKPFILFLMGILSAVTFLINGVGELILAINSRQAEYKADEFAYKIGYGEQMIDTLYKLHEIGDNTQVGLKNYIKRNHPYLTSRIANLERY